MDQILQNNVDTDPTQKNLDPQRWFATLSTLLSLKSLFSTKITNYQLKAVILGLSFTATRSLFDSAANYNVNI